MPEKQLNLLVRDPDANASLKKMFEICPECKTKKIYTALRFALTQQLQCSACQKDIQEFLQYFMRALSETVITQDMLMNFLKRLPINPKKLVLTLKSMAIFGVTTPATLAAPFQVVWDFTHRCNIKTCKQCYATDFFDSDVEDISKEDAFTIIDELAAMDTVSIFWSGGEPLIRIDDVCECIQYARSRGIASSLVTNGTLLTEENIQKLKAAGLPIVYVSFDGATKESNDALRGEGTFDKAVEGMKRVKAAGMMCSTLITATKTSYKEIEEMYELAEEIPLNGFNVLNFLPAGAGKENFEELTLSAEEYDELNRWLYDRREEGKFVIFSLIPSFTRIAHEKLRKLEKIDKNGDAKSLQDISPKLLLWIADPELALFYYNGQTLNANLVSQFHGGCSAGRVYAGITADGKLKPCPFYPLEVGDALHDDLENLWLNSPEFKEMRDRANFDGFCAKCSYRDFCGGCRGRSWALSDGNIKASDPYCVLTQ
ncbi:MAG: radical SAM protein [Theionarchaea archaeon]|nr:radical SAM protein [Theionarchaea archaeon]